jgi:hypothetical protein
MSSKENRCWPGWEPVPGKKKHEQGSCRKKARSKSTSSERAAQTRRKRQLDRWSRAHPGKRRQAAQHLQKPTAKSTKRAKSKRAPAKSKRARKTAD